ncbi:MAG: YvcK family protein [Rhodospirillales bacterium]|nr:YvcK family protein [Rhodospirillales bacterium]
MQALADPGLQGVVICPSNPFISVEPILAIPGVRDALAACKAPVIAVSPIIAGRAVKGPTAKMMTELGLDPSAGTVAHRYADLLDGYVIDNADMAEVVSIDARVTLAQTLMTTMEDREALARLGPTRHHRAGFGTVAQLALALHPPAADPLPPADLAAAVPPLPADALPPALVSDPHVAAGFGGMQALMRPQHPEGQAGLPADEVDLALADHVFD